MSKTDDFRAEHHELQRLLRQELQTYGPHEHTAEEADMVAWHLADVTLQVVIAAVRNRRA